jgi:hypothetical protein
LTRALIIALCLAFYSQAALAEIVYYCASEQIVRIEKDKSERLTPKRFKLVLEGDASTNDFKIIVFRGGLLDKLSFDMHYAADDDWWQAGSEKSTFVFRNGWLHAAVSTGKYIISFSSKCDKL